MSEFGAFLDRQADIVFTRWTERVHGRAPRIEGYRPVLSDHVPALIRDLGEALRQGRSSGPTAETLAQGREGRSSETDSDIDGIVQEYNELLGVVLDLAESEKVTLSIPEVRMVTSFVAQAVAHGVASYRATERIAHRLAGVQGAQLRALIDTAPIGIATWTGPDYVFTSANELYLRALGRGPEVLGKPLVEAFPELPNDHPILAVLEKVFRTGEPFVDPEYHITLTVDERPREKVYVFNVTAIRDAEGNIYGLMGCIADVTDTVRFRQLVEVERDLATAVAEVEAQTRLASDASRARTEFLLAVAAALNASLDLDVVLQRLVDLIAPARAAFATVWSAAPGYAPRRRAHAPFREVLARTDASPTQKDPAALPIEHVMASGETLRIPDFEAWMSRVGASEVGRSLASLGFRSVIYVPILRGDVVVAVMPIAFTEGTTYSEEDVAIYESVARLAGLAFENARLYGEMIRLRESAEAATKAKDRFLARVSHDLRNPLNSILGWASLLRDTKRDEGKLMRGIDVIERNAKSQVQLIEDLLDVSRIASGKLALEITVEDARAAIETSLDAARLAAAAKKVRLVVSVADDIGTIAVDPDRFRQILWNLVSNAVKFTPTGGTVRVIAERRASTLRLEVSDDGLGISTEFLPRVFGSFEQAEAGSQRSGGLGLGLAIVRDLVELHGGTIQVASEGVGKGSRFTVELPIRAAVPTPPPPISSSALRVLEKIRVLVVDDEEDAREVVTIMLEHAGATVTTAASADEGLAKWLGSNHDVIVSDIAMPGKDGKSFIHEVRALSAANGRRVHAVALTALVGAKDRLEVLQGGFDAHIGKPVEPSDLVDLISSLIHR